MQGNSPRLTARSADMAVELRDALRTLFRRDGVVDITERRILNLATAMQQETNRVDESLGVLLCGFRERGIDGTAFRRRLREHDHDTGADAA